MTLLPSLALHVGLPVLGLALLLTLVRLAKGPTLADRVVALDLLGTLGISVVAVVALPSMIPRMRSRLWSVPWMPSICCRRAMRSATIRVR